jgi:hypothetical protein
MGQSDRWRPNLRTHLNKYGDRHTRPCDPATVCGDALLNGHQIHSPRGELVVRAVIQDADGINPRVDVVGLELTALIDTRQVVE